MKKKPSSLRNSRRKPNNPEENMTERITFRLTPAEKNQLAMKAKERGLKLSLLCRLIVMRRVIPDHSPQTLHWLRDLAGMKNNLNQIAHYAHTVKGCDDRVANALIFMATEMTRAKNILTHNAERNE